MAAGRISPARLRLGLLILAALVVIAAAAAFGASKGRGAKATAPGSATTTTPAGNIYAAAGSGMLSSAVAGDPARVYVPNGRSNTVSVIDPSTRSVVATFKAGREPQHIVPSYDLRTLWVLDNQGNDVIPIDAATGKPGAPLHVDDPYNLYFTPDGRSAIVVAEAHVRLEFRDPHTMALEHSLPVPGCNGINHADYNVDGSYLLVTCEFAGKVAKIDMTDRRVVGMLDLTANPVAGQPAPAAMAMPDGTSAASMPQDVRAAPDGHHFYVADMLAGGVFVVNGDSLTVEKFIATGTGAHGLTPSRDGTRFFVANRGSNMIEGPPHGPGSISVLDVATNAVTATWAVPGGGSPDMGNLNAAGTELWLSGRYDSEVYVFDTDTGSLAARIPVGKGPHGLTVWPQPGRYSLGHTGNMR